jgi:hypothetical protein
VHTLRLRPPALPRPDAGSAPVRLLPLLQRPVVAGTSVGAELRAARRRLPAVIGRRSPPVVGTTSDTRARRLRLLRLRVGVVERVLRLRDTATAASGG